MKKWRYVIQRKWLTTKTSTMLSSYLDKIGYSSAVDVDDHTRVFHSRQIVKKIDVAKINGFMDCLFHIAIDEDMDES